MRESYNTRFFQFFLVLVITIVVSETILTHYKKEAYAQESTEGQIMTVDKDSELHQAALESVLGSPIALSEATVAMKAVVPGTSRYIEEVPVRITPSVSQAELSEAANKAQEAIEEQRAAEAAEEEAERAAQEEAERLAEEQAEAERLAAEQAEAEAKAQAESVSTQTPASETQTSNEASNTTTYTENNASASAPVSTPAQESETAGEPEVTAAAAAEEDSSTETESDSSDNGYKYVGYFSLTAYCPCEKCCGPGSTGMTATGTVATQGRTIAANPRILPYGTVVYIEGYGTFTVEDTGGGLSSNTIDIFFASHSDAVAFGRRGAEVYIVG